AQARADAGAEPVNRIVLRETLAADTHVARETEASQQTFQRPNALLVFLRAHGGVGLVEFHVSHVGLELIHAAAGLGGRGGNLGRLGLSLVGGSLGLLGCLLCLLPLRIVLPQLLLQLQDLLLLCCQRLTQRAQVLGCDRRGLCRRGLRRGGALGRASLLRGGAGRL